MNESKHKRLTRFGLASVIAVLGICLAIICLVDADASATTTSEDNVAITIPVACTLVSSGNNSHSANIVNGTYATDIGTTTLKVTCNDNQGFAIYAVGYTGDEIGATNSTKLVGTEARSNTTIDTGTATGPVNNNDTSNWAMKLNTTTSPTPTYPITIDNSYNNYNIVPSSYTKVAHRDSGTDVGTNAIGSTLTTTYAAYISKLQYPDTYFGQVKYTLVHPSSAPEPVEADQIGVIFDGNGQTFNGERVTNRVVYNLSPMYIGTNPTIVKTNNIANDGSKNSSYGSETFTRSVSFNGADKILVELQYGITAYDAHILVVEGEWDGDYGAIENYNYEEIYPGEENLSGTKKYIYNSDEVTLRFEGNGSTEPGYDYGMYARVYPLYNSEQPNTEEASLDYGANGVVDSGNYTTPTNWLGSWYANINGVNEVFANESEVVNFIGNNASALAGSSITLYRGLPFADAYANSNKVQREGYYEIQDLDSDICAAVAIGQNITVIDNRDNNTYMIGRLKDSNCWMLENLRLDPTDSATATRMNTNNTNAPAGAITNYLNGGNVNNVSGWSNVPVSANFGTDTDKPLLINDYKDDMVVAYGPAAVNGEAKKGVFYNYCAATVGTYCYPYSHGFDVEGTLIDAPYSVCPKNWRMPTGGYGGEYPVLYEKYDGNLGVDNPASFQYNFSVSFSGIFDSHFGPGGQDETWNAWTSTYDNSNIYGQRFYFTTDIYGNTYSYTDYGFGGYSVRCIVTY